MSEKNRNKTLKGPLRLVADLLNGRTHTRASAAKLLGVKPATAYRQMSAIVSTLAGMTWDESSSPKRLAFDRRLLSSPPGYAAAAAACFGLSLSSLFNGAHQESGMRSAFQYVLAQSRRNKVFCDIERKFTFVRRGGESALPENSGLLDDLCDAVIHSKTITMKYAHFDGAVETLEIRPYSLSIYDHQIYVIAERDKGEPYPFRFSRIRSISDQDGESFTYPSKAEYDPRQVFSDSFGIFLDPKNNVADVAIKLSSRWRIHAMSHCWHHSQRVEILPTGEVIVKMRVRTCPELTAWVLSFADDAEVVAPKSLQQEVQRRLSAAYAKIDQGQVPGSETGVSL